MRNATAVNFVMNKDVETRGSRSEREQLVRDTYLMRRMRAEGNKGDLMTIAYSGSPKTSDGKLLVSGRQADVQRSRLQHTTEGDFLSCANPLLEAR